MGAEGFSLRNTGYIKGFRADCSFREARRTILRADDTRNAQFLGGKRTWSLSIPWIFVFRALSRPIHQLVHTPVICFERIFPNGINRWNFFSHAFKHIQEIGDCFSRILIETSVQICKSGELHDTFRYWNYYDTNVQVLSEQEAVIFEI